MKIISLFVLVIVGTIAFAYPLNAQTRRSDDSIASFQVEFDKSSYVLFEPIYAKFKLTLTSTEERVYIPSSSITVNFNGKVKVFYGLSSSSVCFQMLPRRDNTFHYITYEEEEMIEKFQTFFSKPGNYQIQFSYRAVQSNIINITIEEPTGINKEAFDFLSKYENPLLFRWIFEKDNGIAQLETFVNKYGESVYGESAAYTLGVVYLDRKPDKAKVVFEKLKDSKNQRVAKDAKTNLRNVEANLEEEERQKTNREKLKENNP